jgi:hypothetical protein
MRHSSSALVSGKNVSMTYAIASTDRTPNPHARSGPQPAWHPAGSAHAVLARTRGGGHHPVTMCGLAVRRLHLFEPLEFLRVRLCPECRDCREWVLAEERRLISAVRAPVERFR